VTNLGTFAIVSDGSALPVELLYFYGEKEGENVLLSWETATELNNDYFDVEYSLDGINFEKIGQVQGAGTTIENQSYEFLHNPRRDIAVQRFYYRLKQVDFDRKQEYTDIIQITFDIEQSVIINVYPNPATDFINIKINETQIGEMVQIIDIQGRILAEFRLEGLSSQYQVSNFPVGAYFIKIGKEVQKIVIVK
jgi:hypothetical protein